MAAPRGAAERATPLRLLLVVALLASAAAQDTATQDPAPCMTVNTVATSSDAEAEVAMRMVKALSSASDEILTGESDSRVFAFAEPENATSVDVKAVGTKIVATALASWTTGVLDAPSNRGLKPNRLLLYNLTHYYQMPENPIGLFVWFHGCYHSASGGWPYDPVGCPECLGLPEEVAHTKQALSRGYAVLAMESKNQEYQNRCFNYGPQENISDAVQVTKIIERFVFYRKSLHGKPIYVAGVSSGASFAVKIPKAFYAPNMTLRVSGAISEANAIPMKSWGLLDAKDQGLRYPGFPPVAYVVMGQNDPDSKVHAIENVAAFRKIGIPSDWVSVGQRTVNESFFSDRSPTVTLKQSVAIVTILKQLGVVDKNGNLMGDPRIDAWNKSSVMFKWNAKLKQRIPWLNLNSKKPPMLSVLSDRSAIYEEMNAAFARHEIISDDLVPCLAWLEKNGKADLKELTRQLRAEDKAAEAQPLSPGDVLKGIQPTTGSSNGSAKAAAAAEKAEKDLADLQAVLAAAKAAQGAYSTFSQEQVDKIFKAAAIAANNARIPLAKMAVEETGMGVVEDKVTKNHFASEFVYNKYKNEKTCGVIGEDLTGGVTKVAEPVGVIAGIVPCTNPTSTAIFKALLTLKTRNALILCPHPRATKCTTAAAKIVRDAAEAAGCPPGVISCIESPSLPITQAVMSAPEVSLVLATGGPSMVRAAYSSGHPALGVGAGNTPAVIDETADVQTAVSSILLSKTFDNGVICASEQSVVAVDAVYDQVVAEFSRRGAYFLKPEEKDQVRSKIFVNGRLNADIVGQSAQKLADIFGITVPFWAKCIIGEVEVIGKEEPLSEEKLCPVLAMYRASDFEDAVDKADRLVNLFGPGHTSVLYTNPRNRKHIDYFARVVKTVRMLVNTPASQGAVGDLYNFQLNPSLTLGCGSWGSTSVSTNVGPHHLLNVKSAIERRENMLWFRVPPKVYFKGGSLGTGLLDLKGKQRAFIVTDKPLYDLGYVDRVTSVLDSMGIHHRIFYDVAPDPTRSCIEAGVAEINEFRPDVIIALGGGSPMDAAKVMWLMYEVPDVEFESLAVRFMDIRKRVYTVPELGKKADMVCVPTTSGTGSEVTPFAVVTDDKTGMKYPLADYALTPTMAIVDTHLVLNMPPKLTAYGGLDTLTHALESYVSIFATPYTKGLSKEATSLIIKYLPRAYANGSEDYEARENVHSAATIAGMAFGNAMLGICHSMAHKLGAQFHVPHGLANAALITHVIRFNATDRPPKQAAFPQYEYPRGKERYAELADMLGLGGAKPRDKVVALILAIEALKAQCGVPATLREIIGAEREGEYMAALDEMAENAFDDQCTGANPRFPRISELKQMLKDAWEAPIASSLTAEAGLGATQVPIR